jgi:hypothetical protein
LCVATIGAELTHDGWSRNQKSKSGQSAAASDLMQINRGLLE